MTSDSSQVFAITIPCFKSEKTIAETLEGVMAQGETLNRVSCVVIADDVSPDRTVEIAKEVWTLPAPPLKFEQRRKNVGEMVNVNMTVAGLPDDVEWFLHMHGDNIPKPGWLQLLTDACLAAAPTTGIVCASYDTFGEGPPETGDEYPGKAPELIKGGLESLRGTIKRGCWWHNSCSATRVPAFREVGGFPPGMRQKGDWDFLLRFLRAGWDIEYLPRTLMLYRMHEASASGFAFRTHLDVEESLQVIQKNAPLLKAADIVDIHARYSASLMRRLGRSALKGDFGRFANSARMMVRTAANCVSCLASG